MNAGERAKAKRERGPLKGAEMARLVLAIALLPVAVLGVWCFLSLIHGEGFGGPGQ